MRIADHAQDPAAFTYYTLRKAVGIVAVGLPFALSLPWWIVGGHSFEKSISMYYHTGMRNLFVGSLCAIAMFLLCARGFDRKDEIAGIVAAICAVGVAFFPTTPLHCPTPLQHEIGKVHYAFAALLFSILAYFCLVLFRMTAADHGMTAQKVQRNRVYLVCGWAIIASMALIAVLALLKIDYLPGGLGSSFCFESTALIAFGVAWLVKGEMFLKDKA
jgi:hypothetical protein